MRRATVKDIAVVRAFAAQLGTYAVEGEAALSEINTEIEHLNDRSDAVRSRRRQRRDDTEQQLRDVLSTLSRCGEGDEALIAELEARADRLREEMQDHDDKAQELEVALARFADAIASFRSAAGRVAGLMQDGAQGGQQLLRSMDVLDGYAT